MRYQLDVANLSTQQCAKIEGELTQPEPTDRANALVRILAAFPEVWVQAALVGDLLQFDLIW